MAVPTLPESVAEDLAAPSPARVFVEAQPGPGGWWQQILPDANDIRLDLDAQQRPSHLSVMTPEGLEFAVLKDDVWRYESIEDGQGQPLRSGWAAPRVFIHDQVVDVITPAEIPSGVFYPDDLQRILHAQRRDGRWHVQEIAQSLTFDSLYDARRGELLQFDGDKRGDLFFRVHRLGEGWGPRIKITSRVSDVLAREGIDGTPWLLLPGPQKMTLASRESDDRWSLMFFECTDGGVSYDLVVDEHGTPHVFWIEADQLMMSHPEPDRWMHEVVIDRLHDVEGLDGGTRFIGRVINGVMHVAIGATPANVTSEIVACRQTPQGWQCTARGASPGTLLRDAVGIHGALYGLICDDTCRFEHLIGDTP